MPPLHYPIFHHGHDIALTHVIILARLRFVTLYEILCKFLHFEIRDFFHYLDYTMFFRMSLTFLR